MRQLDVSFIISFIIHRIHRLLLLDIHRMLEISRDEISR
jgi:hypothetical protein